MARSIESVPSLVCYLFSFRFVLISVVQVLPSEPELRPGPRVRVRATFVTYVPVTNHHDHQSLPFAACLAGKKSGEYRISYIR